MNDSDLKSEVIQKLRSESYFTLTEICKVLGVTRFEVQKLAESDPSFENDLRQGLANMRQIMVDVCERQLADKVAAGDSAALVFVAKTQGRDRGYGDKLEIDNKTAVKVDINEAARRIAFAMQAAIASGKAIDGHFSEVVPLEGESLKEQDKERAALVRKAKQSGLIDKPAP